MSGSRLLWLLRICSAGLGLAGLVLLATPASSTAATRPATAHPASRYNVGATHSPQLLRQLAGGSGPASGGLRAAVAGRLAGARQGVDVAAYQHPGGAPINWSQVAQAGISFAAVKATEGTYYQNPYALSDIAAAQAAGLSVGAYAFAIPNGNGGSGSAVAQADYLISYLGPLSTSVPVMLDIEFNPYAGGTCYGLSPTQLVSWVSAFSAEVLAKTGHAPYVYTAQGFWDPCTGGSAAVATDPLWVANYTTATSPALPAGWANWTVWQYSSTGTVSGIDAPGSTDLDQLQPGLTSLGP